MVPSNDSPSAYPEVVDPERVGSYSAVAGSGGGLVWDAVLEYRVWMSPRKGAPDEDDGSDYYFVFAKAEDALECAARSQGAEEPLALIVQEEYIEEANPGEYEHMRERRVAEWPLAFLSRPRRTARTIPDFLAPDAPPNRLEILRGTAQ